MNASAVFQGAVAPLIYVRFTPESGHVQCNKAMSALCH